MGWENKNTGATGEGSWGGEGQISHGRREKKALARSIERVFWTAGRLYRDAAEAGGDGARTFFNNCRSERAGEGEYARLGIEAKAEALMNRERRGGDRRGWG